MGPLAGAMPGGSITIWWNIGRAWGDEPGPGAGMAYITPAGIIPGTKPCCIIAAYCGGIMGIMPGPICAIMAPDTIICIEAGMAPGGIW